jgi:hypothetical protein
MVGRQFSNSLISQTPPLPDIPVVGGLHLDMRKFLGNLQESSGIVSDSPK